MTSRDSAYRLDSPLSPLQSSDLFQLETVQSSLQTDPDNEELKALILEIEEAITTTESLIAELRPPSPPPEATKAQHPAEKPKWSVENHPAYQGGLRKPPGQPPAEDAPVTYKVNDMVLAKWVTGDKAFYPARITSITGSHANPVYYVTFKSYGTTEALRAPDLRPMSSHDSKKRKADGSSALAAAAPTAAPAAPPNVISAAADINPALASAVRKEPAKVSDGPPKPPKIARKVKANKELEAGKSKWQSFSTKGKLGKGAKKESMFRTGDSVTARGWFAPLLQY
jgi:survival of motor neuron-related-splicing factor 30